MKSGRKFAVNIILQSSIYFTTNFRFSQLIRRILWLKLNVPQDTGYRSVYKYMQYTYLPAKASGAVPQQLTRDTISNAIIVRQDRPQKLLLSEVHCSWCPNRCAWARLSRSWCPFFTARASARGKKKNPCISVHVCDL